MKTLDGLAILHAFSSEKVNMRLSEELCTEFTRLDDLDEKTSERYNKMTVLQDGQGMGRWSDLVKILES